MKTTCPECDRLRVALAEADARKDQRKMQTVLVALLHHTCSPSLAAQLWPGKVVVVR